MKGIGWVVAFAVAFLLVLIILLNVPRSGMGLMGHSMMGGGMMGRMGNSAAPGGGDAATGEELAISCSGCHGTGGVGGAPGVPILAGQPESYLIGELEAFRGGSRRSPVMNPIAAKLSDEDIRALAAYFSKLP